MCDSVRKSVRNAEKNLRRRVALWITSFVRHYKAVSMFSHSADTCWILWAPWKYSLNMDEEQMWKGFFFKLQELKMNPPTEHEHQWVPQSHLLNIIKNSHLLVAMCVCLSRGIWTFWSSVCVSSDKLNLWKSDNRVCVKQWKWCKGASRAKPQIDFIYYTKVSTWLSLWGIL